MLDGAALNRDEREGLRSDMIFRSSMTGMHGKARCFVRKIVQYHKLGFRIKDTANMVSLRLKVSRTSVPLGPRSSPFTSGNSSR
jgi:hypothetical protein